MSTRSLVLTYLTLALLLSGCTNPASDQKALTQEQVEDAAWGALEPNTSSHDRANWQTETLELVEGQHVADRFEGESAPGCMGPKPPPNQPVSPSATYWHVVMRPVPVTPQPWGGTPAPTAPPLIPEPFTREAQFLLDADQGTVVARKLMCVIY